MKTLPRMQVYLLLAALTFTAAMLLATPSSAAATWIVDDDNASRLADFTTIQEAIDAASPGDIILVYPGLYTETLTINKSLTLVSVNGSKQTFIEFPSSDIGINITGTPTTITGFTFNGSITKYAIYLNASGDLKVVNVSFNDLNIYSFIRVQCKNYTGMLEVLGCQFSGKGEAIDFYRDIRSNAKILLYNCSFNLTSNDYIVDGDNLCSQATVNVSSCTIHSAEGILHFDYGYSYSKFIIENCHGATYHQAVYLDLYSHSQLLFTNNILTSLKNYDAIDVSTWGKPRIDICNNKIIGYRTAIELSVADHAEANITGNRLQGSKENSEEGMDISLSEYANCIIADNTIEGFTHGIRVSAQEANGILNIFSNTIHDCCASGIKFDYCVKTTINAHHNIIINCSYSGKGGGLDFLGSDDVTAYSNTLKNCLIAVGVTEERWQPYRCEHCNFTNNQVVNCAYVLGLDTDLEWGSTGLTSPINVTPILLGFNATGYRCLLYHAVNRTGAPDLFDSKINPVFSAASEGETITVFPGYYSVGSLTINKGVYLKSVLGPKHTVLRGSITIQQSNYLLSGFDVYAYGYDYGVHITGASNVTICNCIIHDAYHKKDWWSGGRNIYIESSSNVTLKDVVLKDGNYLNLQAYSCQGELLLANVTATGGKDSEQQGHFMYVSDCSKVVICNSSFYDNKGGFTVDNAANLIVINLVYRNNTRELVFECQSSLVLNRLHFIDMPRTMQVRAKEVVMKNCLIQNVTYTGYSVALYISAQDNVTMDNCIVADCYPYGAFIAAGGNVHVANCTFTNNNRAGLGGFGEGAAEQAVLPSNGVQEITPAGLWIRAYGSIRIEGCAFKDSRGTGLVLVKYPSTLGETSLGSASTSDLSYNVSVNFCFFKNNSEYHLWAVGGAVNASYNDWSCYTFDEIEGKIYHYFDHPSPYGGILNYSRVYFTPWLLANGSPMPVSAMEILAASNTSGANAEVSLPDGSTDLYENLVAFTAAPISVYVNASYPIGLEAASYLCNPAGTALPAGFTALPFFTEFAVGNFSALEEILLAIHYSDSDVETAKVSEYTLTPFYFKDGEWHSFSSYSVDIEGNTVYIHASQEELQGATIALGGVKIVTDSKLKLIGTPRRDTGVSIICNSDGSWYIAGSTEKVLKKARIGACSPRIIGAEDSLLVKLSPEGSLEWAIALGLPGRGDEARCIKISSSEELYLLGNLKGLAKGATDFYLAKIAGNGTILWSTISQGGYHKYAWDMDIYNNCIYVVGEVRQKRSLDAFIAKLDSSGNLIWAKVFGGKKHDAATCIALYNSAVYVAGWTKSYSNSRDIFLASFNPDDGSLLSFKVAKRKGNDIPVDLAPIQGGFLLAAKVGKSTRSKIMVAKLGTGSSGSQIAVQWCKILGGRGKSTPTAVKVNGSWIYIAGWTKGFKARAVDALIARLKSSDGSLDWLKVVRGNKLDLLSSIAVNGVYLMAAGSTISKGAKAKDLLLLQLYANATKDLKGNYLWYAGGRSDFKLLDFTSKALCKNAILNLQPETPAKDDTFTLTIQPLKLAAKQFTPAITAAYLV